MGNADSASGRRTGLLIAPRFPANTFWSFHHVVEMVGRKAMAPPLGLLSFAAEMPSHWDFTLLDLNVADPPGHELRKSIEHADAVFVSAMSIQKKSLVGILDGPARDLKTPWVLGGSYPSTYRDSILDPKNQSDQILFEGLDLLVWGESFQWIDAIEHFLERNPTHSGKKPAILIPETVAKPSGREREYLNDRAIFKDLPSAKVPRWDLLESSDYLMMMMQTTVGCPFRCDFCDIIDFNGGFARVKALEDVRRELEALYRIGHRGPVFTVDDNFIGDPIGIVGILDEIAEFQRQHEYPFRFVTQASVNLGTPSLQHLIGKMRNAGFMTVFMGIENPDPIALNLMNKNQNKMVDIAATVALIQGTGIEVAAGFILGGDADTPKTADEIVRFVQQTSITTAMTGILGPIPHTPLYRRLEREGRLLGEEYVGNTVDDNVLFEPRGMTKNEVTEGARRILRRLFNSGEYFRRATKMQQAMEQHIFGGELGSYARPIVAIRCIWQQGFRRLDYRYFKFLWSSILLDRKRQKEAELELKELVELRSSFRSGSANTSASSSDTGRWEGLLEHASRYLVRFDLSMTVREIEEFISATLRRIKSGSLDRLESERLCDAAIGFQRAVISSHRFPGSNLTHGLFIGMQGLHYERVMRTVTASMTGGHTE